MFCVYVCQEKDKEWLADFENESEATSYALKYYTENKTVLDTDLAIIEVWECYKTTESDHKGTCVVRNRVELVEVFRG